MWTDQTSEWSRVQQEKQMLKQSIFTYLQDFFTVSFAT